MDITVDDAYEELQAALSDGVIPEDFEGPPPDLVELFDGDDAAIQEHLNKALRKVGVVRRRFERDKEVAAAELDRVKLWLERRRKVAEDVETWLTGQAEGYMRQRFEAYGAQSLGLPNGRWRLTKRRQRVEYVGTEEELWDFDEDLTRAKVELAKTEVAKVARPGERITGYDAPVDEGYEPWTAVVSGEVDPDTGVVGDDVVLPGVVLMVPVEGNRGYSFGPVISNVVWDL